jgi:radical SAM superfamily enzyme YgiQ (UPF0313 family)
MRDAAFKMIEMAKSRGCIVILCGADATDHYPTYLEKGADYVLIGEGEETLVELLGTLSAGADPSQIVGLAFRQKSKVKRRPDISDLDTLPFPAWDLVDIERYRIWSQRAAAHFTATGVPNRFGDSAIIHVRPKMLPGK